MSSTNLDHLINQLKTDLKPVRRKSVGEIYLFLGVLIILMSLLLMSPPFAARPDFFVNLGLVSFAALILTGASILCLTAIMLARSTLVGGVRPSASLETWRFAGILLYGSSAFVYSAQYFESWSWGFIADKNHFSCTILALLLAAPSYFILVLWSAWIFPASPRYFRAALSLSFVLGLLLNNVHCPYDLHGHHILGHALFPLGLLVLLYPPCRSLSLFISSWAIRRRTSSLKERLSS